ncbi:MAG: T9SS type A sorting domain-containing protein [Saprospiraceae bacterium]|nr:T9SS type A sorting domain-containing protein [Saprospiraceae bacterium]
MKHFLNFSILFIFLISYKSVSAQFFDFENSCSDHSSAFSLGCIKSNNLTWINTHGSSDNNTGNPLETPFGIRSANMYVIIDGNCTGETARKGEGIALPYNFIQGKTYFIKYSRKIGTLAGTNYIKAQWILANGLVNVNGSLINCTTSANDAIPPIPMNSQILKTYTQSTGWVEDVICFVPERNYTHLWFRSIIEGPTANERKAFVRLDNFTISEEPVLNAYTTDASGNPKSTFCFGEDVYLKVLYPFTDNNIYVDAWLDPNYLVDWYTGPGDVTLDNNNMINLSQTLFDRNQRHYDPSRTYYLKVADVTTNGCWVESKTSFNYVCCEDVDYCSFRSEVSSSSAPFTITSRANKDYTKYGVTHQFCIYSDVNNDGIYEFISCSDGPNSSFTGGVVGVRYYILHRVITPCGDYCCVISHCVGCNTSNAAAGDNLTCESFIPYCTPVPKPNCPLASNPTPTSTSLLLAWPAVLNATSYEIQIIINDPSCGCTGPVSTANLTSTASNITLSSRDTRLGIPACFSYRIRSVCSDNLLGRWSPKRCYPSCTNTTLLRNVTDNPSRFEIGDVTVSPNPSSGEINIQNIQLMEDEKYSIAIYGYDGKKHIQSDNLSGPSATLDITTIPIGMYFIRIHTTSGKMKSFKVIKI